MGLENLKYDLKKLIVDECEKDEIKPEEINDDEQLFSKKNGLELDSLDALQISMGIQKKYGIRLGDPKEFRRRVTTIQELAEYINHQHG